MRIKDRFSFAQFGPDVIAPAGGRSEGSISTLVSVLALEASVDATHGVFIGTGRVLRAQSSRR